jgi:hypothetical protein
MSSTIRPDEFSKYAPRWSRDKTVKPRDAITLPPAPQLARMELGEPAWRRGPSPFEGEIRPWLKREMDKPTVLDPEVLDADPQVTDVQVPDSLPIFASRRVQIGLVEGLFSTAAVVSFAAIAVVGVGLVLSPNAPREVQATRGASMPERVAAQAAMSTQREKLPPVNSATHLAVSDLWPTEPGPWSVEATPKTPDTKTPDNAPTVNAAAPPPQISNAVYVVASADPSALRQVRAQPPADPEPAAQQPAQQQPAQQQPQAKQYAGLQGVQTERVLSPDSVDRLVSRGEAFLAQGDVAAARVLLERAAETRDPRAALALGSTYDPNVLKRMGVVGIRPDPEQAHLWYERAAEFGSGEANQALTALAQLSR